MGVGGIWKSPLATPLGSVMQSVRKAGWCMCVLGGEVV